ncbi:MAG: alpha/beta fold hydrolase [Burkholderiales bacterium]|nr:alpha/beta fold hydrolase [Burkholderiales bacterium]
MAFSRSASLLLVRQCLRRLSPTCIALFGAAAAGAALAQPLPAGLLPCRLPGFEHEAACGRVRRPLDPAAPQGGQIDIHFAVLPALARNKHPDPVFVFAGGPGQSAIDLAGSWSRLLARVSNRRDIVLVDQRGTGRSAKLACDEPVPTAPLATVLPAEAQARRLANCRETLQRLPHGDLRHYTTWVAMADVEAVRQALGSPRVNLVGGSYGTRAALEYQRQFPQAVRRLVIDGVAPPDMVLPGAFSVDGQAALEQVFTACEADAAICRPAYPALRDEWRALLAGLPKEVTVAHPGTGAIERLTLTRELLLGLVRAPLYAPALAAGLPQALSEAARGRYEPLFALASALQGARSASLAEGMHLSVVCAEDVPRAGAAAEGGAGAAGADFASAFADQYRRLCVDWPRGEVPAAFYTVPPAPAAALVLSGGADPATPPRHGERVAKALGAKARHVVVAEAGHGVMALPCMRGALFRFIDAPDDAQAMQVKADCAAAVPRPGVFVPLRPAGGGRP